MSTVLESRNKKALVHENFDLETLEAGFTSLALGDAKHSGIGGELSCLGNLACRMGV